MCRQLYFKIDLLNYKNDATNLFINYSAFMANSRILNCEPIVAN